MTRIYLLVEGQTEEAFVTDLLQPHYARLGKYLYPIIVSTSPGHRGGVVSYAKIKPQIDRLCRQHSTAWVTTMFDLYALPSDFPGKSTQVYMAQTNGHEKALQVEAALMEDMSHQNFIANILVHEFEALLFTQIDAFCTWVDDDSILAPLRTARKDSLPEDINDSPQTAPSKRILSAMPRYQKTVHGPLIACDIGLDAIRAACPHFHAWLNRIEALN